MKTLQFDYFRGMEAEKYSFYRVPKVLFTAECFWPLSCEAKVLYGLMLDRMGLSVRNRWFDEEDRVYIIFTVDEIMGLLGCSRQKAVKSIAELDVEKGIGLIEKKRLGLGRSNVIYVKNFMACENAGYQTGEESPEEMQEAGDGIFGALENALQEIPESDSPNGGSQTARCGDNGSPEVSGPYFQEYENHTSGSMKHGLSEVPESYFQKYENHTSGSMKNGLQEVPEPDFQKYENHTSGSMKNGLQEVPGPDFQKYENHTSGSMKNGLQEVPKSYCNKTEKIETENIETEWNETEENETEGNKTDRMDRIRSNPINPINPIYPITVDWEENGGKDAGENGGKDGGEDGRPENGI